MRRTTGGAYVRTDGTCVRIGNRRLELGFDVKSDGRLVSVLDRRSRQEFVRDRGAPGALFRLGLRRPDGELDWLDSRAATRVRWSKHQDAAGCRLTLVVSGFKGAGRLRVAVEIRLANGSPLSAWRAAMSGVPADRAVAELVCPIVSGVLTVGKGVPGECVVAPVQGEGYLFRDPYPVVDNLPLMAGEGDEAPWVGMGSVGGTYPGALPVQLMMYYTKRAGLYLACHDSGQHAKRFQLGEHAGWGLFPVFTVHHLVSETPGGEVTLAYDTMVGVFRGDWHDGADIYKAWARRQWWCARKLAERDSGRILRKGFGVWQMSNYHIPKIKLNHSLDQIAREVNALSKDIGVPLLALIFNFEEGGAWTGPVGFFPMREGDAKFRAAMKKLRAAGNHGFMYMPGGIWYVAIDSYDPPFDSWKEYEAKGRAASLTDSKGNADIQKWYAGWHAARLCPRTPYIRKMTADLLLGLLKRGADVVQIDNFPCVGPGECHAARHGHPRGYGRWHAQAWCELLADVRRRAKALNPDCLITTEGISENYIPWLDLFDQRAGNMEYFGHRSPNMPCGGRTIPLFSYIYSGYIGAYLAAYPECNRPEVLYWTRCLGKALAQGAVPTGGRYWPEPKRSNPVTLAFYKKVVRAAARECWRYIMFGEMLRPPEIKVPPIRAAFLKFSGECLDHLLEKNRHEVVDDAVQHSAWRAEDGTIGYIFVNVSQEPVAFDFRLSAYTAGGRDCRVEIVTNGKRRVLYRRRRLPCRQTLRMQPLSVALVEVKG